MNTSHLPNHKLAVKNDLSASPASANTATEIGVIQTADRQVILSEPQRQVLEWLYNEEGATVKDAAEFAGVGRATIFRWIQADPDFNALYTAWRQQQEQAKEVQLSGLEAAALNVLNDAVRRRGDVRAAQFILKQMTARWIRKEKSSSPSDSL